MPKYVVEIPVRITREKAFGVDFEPTLDKAVKFELEADDENDAVEFVGLLLMNMLDDEAEAPGPALLS